MMTNDKALLIGWAGVIVGVAAGFRVAHTRLPLNDAISTDVVFVGFGGVALFILLNRRISDGYRVVYALAFFYSAFLQAGGFSRPPQRYSSHRRYVDSLGKRKLSKYNDLLTCPYLAQFGG